MTNTSQRWSPEAGFDGTLHELFGLMLPYYPRPSALMEVQRWLLSRATVENEVFITRLHASVARGEYKPAEGAANGYLTSDNEFAASIFGLTFAGHALPLHPPVGGTSLYRARGEQRLKLAHLSPAAHALGAARLDAAGASGSRRNHHGSRVPHRAPRGEVSKDGP